MPIKIKYYILFFIPFFFLLYSESLEFGGMSVSQLWKIPFAGYLIYYLFQYRHMPTPKWAQFQYWLSLKYFVKVNHIATFMPNMLAAFKALFLPLLFNFFCNKQWKTATLKKILLVISQYFILTNIPFMLGMKTLRTGVDYGNFVAYTGIFQYQHAMSVIMAICIIVILDEFKRGDLSTRFSRIYNVGLIALAAYAMYLGFARTGWLMCVLAVIVLFLPKNMNVRQWIGIVTIIMVLVVGFVFLFVNNAHFHDRIVGNDLQTHQKINIDSGRSQYIEIAWNRYTNGSVSELLVGVSYEEVREVILEKTGLHIGAHNGFVDMLAANGIVGLGLMLLFMFSLLGYIWRRKRALSFRLAMAMWVMYFSFQMTQGGYMFHSDLLYALIYCILEKEYRQTDELNNIEEC